MDIVYDDFVRFAFDAVLVFIRTGLHTPLHSHQLAFFKVPADKFGLLIPGDNVEKIGLALHGQMNALQQW